MAPAGDGSFCRQAALEAGAQIAGTALEQVWLWVLVEYSGAWGAKALEQSRLPKAVRRYLTELQQQVSGCRVHFIRQSQQVPASGQDATLIVFRADELSPVGWRMRLPSYSALPELGLQAWAKGEELPGAVEIHAPTFLVCTNGKRDRCCAKWGRPAYRELERLASPSVWQTTHTGGHRFAPNVICLPHGVMYGWLEIEELTQLEESYRRGRLHRLDRFRGRARFPRPAQAAEVFLRRSSGVLGLERYKLLDCAEVGDRLWRVTFHDLNENIQHELLIQVEDSPTALQLSCEAEPKPVTRYRLQAHRSN